MSNNKHKQKDLTKGFFGPKEPPKPSLDIHIWEKNAAIGGRFQTFPEPNNGNNSVDLGAQYLSHTRDCAWSKPYFDELIHDGLLKELDTTSFPGFHQDETKIHFVCTKGTGSIVEHYFAKANGSHKIKLNHAVNEIKIEDDQSVISVCTSVSPDASAVGKHETFDIIISTIPVSELLHFKNIHQYAEGTQLSNVKYTSRYAIGIFFNEKLHLQKSVNQALNFVQTPGSPIRYWSLENLKRSAGDYDIANSQLPASVVHTSVDYGAQHSMMTDVDMITTQLLQQLKTETDLVKDSSKYASVICHRWNCSQVSAPYPNSPGFLVLHTKPLILACGDGFTYSGFEGCIKSAEETVKYLSTYFCK